MPSVSNCPTAERLHELATGRLAGDEIDALSSHVLHCSDCAQTLASIESSDTLAEAGVLSVAGSPNSPPIRRHGFYPAWVVAPLLGVLRRSVIGLSFVTRRVNTRR